MTRNEQDERGYPIAEQYREQTHQGLFVTQLGFSYVVRITTADDARALIRLGRSGPAVRVLRCYRDIRRASDGSCSGAFRFCSSRRQKAEEEESHSLSRTVPRSLNRLPALRYPGLVAIISLDIYLLSPTSSSRGLF
ncbi:hypothetical protein TgHK011_004824 [Trichoderma gracile]|nr:hypothetical protein TgHK011_004824 [Trichoderma gracile]